MYASSSTATCLHLCYLPVLVGWDKRDNHLGTMQQGGSAAAGPALPAGSDGDVAEAHIKVDRHPVTHLGLLAIPHSQLIVPVCVDGG
jgi:hypothetical protein